MGFFDRLADRNIARRARILNENGQPAGGHIIDLRGLWGNRFSGRDADLNAIRPSRDEATRVSEVAARAINLRVQQLASRPLLVTSEAGEPVAHPLTDLFNKRPNSFQSALAFRETYLTRLMHYGEAFIVLDRGPSRVGPPTSAVVHHGNVEVVVSAPTALLPHGEVVGYWAQVGEGKVALAPDEVLWLRFGDPSSPWGCRAPLDAALDAIGIARAARRWQGGQLLNGGQPAGIIYLGEVSDAERDAAEEDIDRALNGPSSAGRFALTSGATPPQFIRTGSTAKEVAYLDTLNIAGEGIALALGIPLDLIGGQRTYANVEASWKILWEGTLLPDLALVASEIDRQLLTGTPLNAQFDVSDVPALQEGRDSVAIRVAKAVELDLLTLDEGRQQLGFEPMANGRGAVTRAEYLAELTRNAVSPVEALAPADRALPLAGGSVALEPWTRRGQQGLQADDPSGDLQFEVRGVSLDDAERDLDRLEASAVRTLTRLADAQLREAKKRLNRNQRSNEIPADPNLVFNEAAWVERAYEFLLPVLYAGMDAGAAGTAKALGMSKDVSARIARAAEERAEVLAEQVNETTGKVLRDRLSAAAVADQLTVTEYARILDTVFDDLKGWRAETIARTEMVGAYNGASRIAALESEVVVAREWLTAGDGRVRDSHVAMNGTRTVSMDDPYPNGLMFPGDPNGDPAESINCRCVELYVTPITPEGTPR